MNSFFITPRFARGFPLIQRTKDHIKPIISIPDEFVLKPSEVKPFTSIQIGYGARPSSLIARAGFCSVPLLLIPQSAPIV
jgi:hypothetical protein